VWDGDLELVVSARLLEELASVLEYPKIRKRLVAGAVDTRLFLKLLPFLTTSVTIGDIAVLRPRDADDWVVLATLVAGGAD